MLIGMIGLDRLGGHMYRRLMKARHHSVQYTRTIWLILPAGRVTEELVELVGWLLDRDDIIVDGRVVVGLNSSQETALRLIRAILDIHETAPDGVQFQ